MKNIEETLDYINLKTNNFKPEFAIILGSGLGCFCDDLNGTVLKYENIPNFSQTNVIGHKGELLFAMVENKPCVIMQGRFHYYEGNPIQKVVFPIKVFKKLKVKTLFITNAAGAAHKNLNIGDIMLIKDHINFIANPLIGKNNPEEGERFPDMSDCYSKKYQTIIKECAKNLNINLKEGVYLATTGPSYETQAEVKAFKLLGADVIGMSSAPEAIMAKYLGINTIGLSLVTNYATGVSDSKPNHKEVIEIGKKSGQKMSLLIKETIKNIGSWPEVDFRC